MTSLPCILRRWTSFLIATSILIACAQRMAAATLDFPDLVANISPPETPVTLRITGVPTTEASPPSFALRVRDWLGNETTLPLSDVTSTQDNAYSASFIPPSPGWMEISLTINGRIDSSSRATTRLAVVPKAKSQGTYFRYGISDHSMSLGGSIRPKALALLDSLGVDIAREDASWHRVKAGPDAPWNFASVDRILADYTERGIEMQPILNYGVPWATTASDPKDARNRMPLMDLWLEYVRTTVNRYQDRVRYWEIWNEPDIGFWKDPTSKHVELFDRTSAEIARLQPDAIIMNGGFAMVSRQPNPRFVEEFISSANPAHWHLRAWHDYNTFGEMIVRQKQHEALYKKYASPAVAALPSWMNEGGYHTIDPTNEAEQARTIVKKVATAPALGLVSYFVYTTRDSSRDRKGPTAPFYGLADFDCRPKPAYAAYNRLIAELAHLRYTPPAMPASSSADEGLWQHLYATPNPAATHHTLVTWREGTGLRSPHWLRWQDAHVSAVFDLMGNPVPIKRLGGGIVVDLDDNPVYIHITGSPSYPQTTPLLQLPNLVSLIPGGSPATLSIGIHNPTTHPISVHPQITPDNPALVVGDASSLVALAPGTTQHLQIPISTTVSGLPRGQLTIGLRATSEDNKDDAITIHASLPYEIANAISPGSAFVTELNQRSDIRNLHEALANPIMEWKGAEDLSASAALEATPDALTLTVNVTDQTHHQPHKRETLWQADSLQFAFRANDTQTGFLEIVLALDQAGAPCGWVMNAPEWTLFARGDIEGQASFNVTRNPTSPHTIYQLTLPWRVLGYEKQPSTAWRASFIVNDDDGLGRKQYIQLSPGIGESKDPQKFPLFICLP